MKIKVIPILMFLLSFVLLTSCNDYDEDYVYNGEALIGKWQETDFDEGFYKTYDFKADGTVICATCIYGMMPEGSVAAEYRVDGTNTLILTENINGKKIVTRMKFSINEDNVLVLVDEQNEDVINKLEPYSLKYDEVSPIKGKWVDKYENNGREQTDVWWFLDDSECFVFPDARGQIGDDVYEFINDGEYAYMMTVLYSTEKNTLNLCFADQFIVSKESVITGEYKIENNKLIISNGGKVVYEFERYE